MRRRYARRIFAACFAIVVVLASPAATDVEVTAAAEADVAAAVER